MIQAYTNEKVNSIYNLLFCDDLNPELDQIIENVYFTDYLYLKDCSIRELHDTISNPSIETRTKIYSYNQLLSKGFTPEKKELLAVIIEIGLENGLDVLATYQDSKITYINQSGKVLHVEKPDAITQFLKEDLFVNAQVILAKIGNWEHPRKPCPTKGNMRITLLVSDGIYFGEGTIDALFNDELAKEALLSATSIMHQIIDNNTH